MVVTSAYSWLLCFLLRSSLLIEGLSFCCTTSSGTVGGGTIAVKLYIITSNCNCRHHRPVYIRFSTRFSSVDNSIFSTIFCTFLFVTKKHTYYRAP